MSSKRGRRRPATSLPVRRWRVRRVDPADPRGGGQCVRGQGDGPSARRLAPALLPCRLDTRADRFPSGVGLVPGCCKRLCQARLLCRHGERLGHNALLCDGRRGLSLARAPLRRLSHERSSEPRVLLLARTPAALLRCELLEQRRLARLHRGGRKDRCQKFIFSLPILKLPPSPSSNAPGQQRALQSAAPPGRETRPPRAPAARAPTT